MDILEGLFSKEQWTEFIHNLDDGQRIGQAFYNAAPVDWCMRLNRTPFDPFFKDSEEAIFYAIDYLTDPKIPWKV